ncbi:MAG: hypothetical protein WAR38_09400 [Chitinophagaceae bacterium]
MKKVFLLILFLAAAQLVLTAQEYINKKKGEVITMLKIKYQQTPLSVLTDTVKMKLENTFAMPFDYIFTFDKTGRCKSETIITRCDSCLTGLLQKVLDLKKFEWNKINENQNISKFEEKLMIELPAENYDHSFSILKVEWTKELYELLLKQ